MQREREREREREGKTDSSGPPWLVLRVAPVTSAFRDVLRGVFREQPGGDGHSGLTCIQSEAARTSLYLSQCSLCRRSMVLLAKMETKRLASRFLWVLGFAVWRDFSVSFCAA